MRMGFTLKYKKNYTHLKLLQLPERFKKIFKVLLSRYDITEPVILMVCYIDGLTGILINLHFLWWVGP
jgi:hypothetical protein